MPVMRDGETCLIGLNTSGADPGIEIEPTRGYILTELDPSSTMAVARSVDRRGWKRYATDTRMIGPLQ